ncbi:MAG: peptidylprolyl isomerase [Desulfobulbaceae bacterium]|uniref:Peptidyl-prolyl cis-trans isomerase n=1 Tax=Candidatus Desulfobia pelagia TaxID=2841692 RepID=A0A8J6NEQ2_9BACT|nr:peptidylprolyl isomerase [Candidatus Desulfobia pelagia]
MKTAQLNDFVTVIYEGFLENGEIFESSSDTGPLDFQIGYASVMRCFEEGVIGMKVDETKEIQLGPKDAYGERQEDLVHTLNRSSWNKDADIKPGITVAMNMEKDGETHQIPATVTDVQGDMVTVDYNHPLAGQKIIFKITLKKIERKAPSIPMNTPGPDSGCGPTH